MSQSKISALRGLGFRAGFCLSILILACPKELWAALPSLSGAPLLPELGLLKFYSVLGLTLPLVLLELGARSYAHHLAHYLENLSKDRRDWALTLLASLTRTQIWRHACLLALVALGLLNAADLLAHAHTGEFLIALITAAASLAIVVWSELLPFEKVLIDAIDALLNFGRRARTYAASHLAGKSLRLVAAGSVVAWIWPTMNALATGSLLSL